MKTTRIQIPDDRRHRRGFSLPDVTAAVFIIGVLAGIVVPRWGNFVTRQRVDAAAERIKLDLALAQKQARFTSTQHKVMFNPAANTYRIQVRDKATASWDDLASLTHSSDAYVVGLSQEPYNSELSSVDFGGDEEVIFDGYGTPDSGGTVTLSLGRYAMTLTFGSEMLSVTPTLVEGTPVEVAQE